MGLVGLLITLIVEVVMLYWPGRLLIKIILIYLYLYERDIQ